MKVIYANGKDEYEFFKELDKRHVETDKKVTETVSEIIDTVRKGGDSAVKAYTEKFDGKLPQYYEVPRDVINDALTEADSVFTDALLNCIENIRSFHERQKSQSFVDTKDNGVILGQRVLPLEKVGLYIPGGTAPLFSTVLMSAIPAALAGCPEIVMATPVQKNGKIAPEMLAAAKIAGVNKIFKVGGAQAIAALAYGTESIPKVDKIVGPGNQYVAEAKRQVFGRVSIDMIAGPSEILIIADKTADPKFLAADLLSQAEHDRIATAVLITDSEKIANDTANELEKQLPKLGRADIAKDSLERNGKIIIAKDLSEAVTLSNEIAPEHLEICTEKPFDIFTEIKNAGSVFLGSYSPEPLGDYFAGPNHTLPTSGTARFSSPLSVDDFVKKMQFSYMTEEAFSKVAEKVGTLADKESLGAHAASARKRIGK